jgi:penicillin amidase
MRLITYAVPVSRRRIAMGTTALAGIIILALIVAAVYTYWSVGRPYPDYDGEVAIPRLSGDVEVMRDEYGIAHIYADTAEDLFRAQGYVHAQDRNRRLRSHDGLASSCSTGAAAPGP